MKIFPIATGQTQTRKLKWAYVDFNEKVLTVPRELTKSDREHRLPLSEFLIALLKKRHLYRNHSEWVFQSTRLSNKPISGGVGMLARVRAKSNIKFTFHDLRRTFLTMGEKLEVPPYALKYLVNHSVSNDITGQYLVLDIERLRGHMARITDAFIPLLGIYDSDMKEWKPVPESELSEVTQLRLLFGEIRSV